VRRSPASGFDLRLEGPTPWRARGRGSIDLFLFSASFDFDEQWGLQPPPPASLEDVGERLREALSVRDAWLIQRPAGGPGALRLTPEAETALGAGELVDPDGSFVVRQRTVPLGVTIERFNAAPVPAQRWDIASAQLGPEEPARLDVERREEFAPGQFFALSDDEKLSRPAFQRLRAGYTLTGTDVAMPEPRGADLDFETKVILEDEPGVEFALAGPARLLALETVAAAASVAHPLWWPSPEPSVSLAVETPVTLASNWSLAAASVPEEASATEMLQVLDGDLRVGLGVVENWELGS
jgi:hypothetical protein